MTRSLLALLVILSTWSPAQAGQTAAQKPTLDSRIDVRIEAMPAVDVVRQIISGMGYELQMDAAIDAPVTLWITRVSGRTALNVVCESLGCTWRLDGNRLVVGRPGGVSARSDRKTTMIGVQTQASSGRAQTAALDLVTRLREPLPVDMQFEDVPVSTILRAMSDASGLEITAEEPLASKRVTLTGSGKTAEDALKAVVEQAGGAIARLTVKDTANPAAPAIRIAIKTRDATIKKEP